MSEENDEGIGKWNFRDKWFCINFEFPRVFPQLRFRSTRFLLRFFLTIC